jgi:hypothetical protein
MRRTVFSIGRMAARLVRREDGAITVDWVVLTAAMVVMVTAVFITINEAVLTDAASGIADNVEEAAVR